MNAAAKVNAIYIPPGVAGANPPLLGSPGLRGIDLVTSCSGLRSIDEELKDAYEVRLRDNRRRS